MDRGKCDAELDSDPARIAFVAGGDEPSDRDRRPVQGEELGGRRRVAFEHAGGNEDAPRNRTRTLRGIDLGQPPADGGEVGPAHRLATGRQLGG